MAKAADRKRAMFDMMINYMLVDVFDYMLVDVFDYTSMLLLHFNDE